jgi:hypothetical protein
VAKKAISAADALKENTAALVAHTRELRRHSAALMAHTAALTPTVSTTARQLVYSVMYQLLPGWPLQDGSELSDLGYDDNVRKDIIRGAIDGRHWHGVNLKPYALNNCAVISDIIPVVAKAEG